MKTVFPGKRHSVRFFSLIEVLTVVAIIAVLASLLFPAMNHMQEQAKRLHCLSKVKDIGAMNMRYASRHNGNAAVFFYGPNEKIDAGATYPGRSYHVFWNSLIADEHAGSYDTSDCWPFICENLTHGWTNSKWGGWTAKWSPRRCEYQYVAPDSEYKRRLWKFPTTYSVSFLGNFGSNHNANFLKRPYVYEDKGTVNTDITEVLPLSSIPRPSVRTYAAEHGEDRGDDNGFQLLTYLKYGTTIDGGYGGKCTSYMPGYGGGGIGKESLEKGGYSAYVRSLDENEKCTPADGKCGKVNGYEMIKKDVEEGRHDGYTLHAFFDGHAEQISADVIGKHQMKSGVSSPRNNTNSDNDVTGLYGCITSAGE